MSLFDKARAAFEGAAGAEASQLISGLIQQHGGVQGLVNQLHQGGLGDAVKSWVGEGPNQAVSAQQIQNALGTGTLAKLAQATGVDPAQAAQHLAKFLPIVIDKLTPNGAVPPAAETPKVNNVLSNLFPEGGAHA
jgi:uncharacterized protein YidB (DUF937 family)